MSLALLRYPAWAHITLSCAFSEYTAHLKFLFVMLPLEIGCLLCIQAQKWFFFVQNCFPSNFASNDTSLRKFPQFLSQNPLFFQIHTDLHCFVWAPISPILSLGLTGSWQLIDSAQIVIGCMIDMTACLYREGDPSSLPQCVLHSPLSLILFLCISFSSLIIMPASSKP